MAHRFCEIWGFAPTEPASVFADASSTSEMKLGETKLVSQVPSPPQVGRNKTAEEAQSTCSYAGLSHNAP